MPEQRLQRTRDAYAEPSVIWRQGPEAPPVQPETLADALLRAGATLTVRDPDDGPDAAEGVYWYPI